jgi:hypothetical protein
MVDKPERSVPDGEDLEPASPLERFMYRSVPLWIVLLVVTTGLLTTWGFGALVLSAERGDQSGLDRLARDVAALPSAVKGNLTNSSLEPFLSPPGGAPLSGGFWKNPDDSFVDPGFLLTTLYDRERRRPFVRLIRLADGATIRDYQPDIDTLTRLARENSTQASSVEGGVFSPGHPDLLDDGGLAFTVLFLMVRTDVCARTVWSSPGHHHSIERDDSENFWTPIVVPEQGRDDVRPAYRNDGVSLMTPDGKTLYARGLTQIFLDNGLEGLLLGRPYNDDPFHLNDVQPVTADGPYWRRGDLFLSLRHLSMVMLFRPSSGKVIWWKIGPWLGQHDVSVLDDHRIAIFDNRTVFGSEGSWVKGNSRQLVFDFSDGSVTSPWEAGFRRQDLAVVSNGRGTPLPNGDLFVEDTVRGQALRMNPNGELRWRYVHADDQKRRYWMFWSRYLDPVQYGAAIRATVAASCP